MFKHVASWGAPDTNCHVRTVAVIQNGKASYSRMHSSSKAHVSEFPSTPPPLQQLVAWTREWALWQNSIFKNIKVCEDKPIEVHWLLLFKGPLWSEKWNCSFVSRLDSLTCQARKRAPRNTQLSLYPMKLFKTLKIPPRSRLLSFGAVTLL